jgi:hypothetical protein
LHKHHAPPNLDPPLLKLRTSDFRPHTTIVLPLIIEVGYEVHKERTSFLNSVKQSMRESTSHTPAASSGKVHNRTGQRPHQVGLFMV